MTPLESLPQDIQYLLGGLGLLSLILFLGLLHARRMRRDAADAFDASERETRELRTRLAEREDKLAERTATLARSEERATEAHVRAERLEETVAGLRDRLGALRQEAGQVQSALELARREGEKLRVEARGREMAMEKDREAAAREIALLKELREEMTTRFRDMSDETLRRQNADFSKAQTDRLTALLNPFREHVVRFEEELRNVHRAADLERARLGEQISLLHRRSEEISQEAVALTRALKGDKQRQGAWGEMILERILEESGLERDIHYEVQAVRRDDAGKTFRPDVIVRMPRGKVVIIDSKVSLVAYESAVNAGSPEERVLHIRDHVAAIRSHIDRLGAKDYAGTDAEAVDYVLMFVPIEGALSEALREQGDLTSYALARGIGLMTPTTLMVALRTIEHVWTVDRREKNAEEIARRAGLLYDKVAGFVDDLASVSTHLGRAASAHEAAVSKLSRGSGNVLGQVDKLKKLGARSNRSMALDFDEEEDTPLIPSHAAE